MSITAEIPRSEMVAFEKALGLVMRKTGVHATTVIKKGAFDFLRDAMRDCPVKTGQARAGFMAGFEVMGRQAPSTGGTSEGVAKGRAQSAAKANLPKPNEIPTKLQILTGKDKPFVEVTNSVGHIIHLEFGGSQQAPNGMVRVNLRKHAEHIVAELKK